MSSQVQAELVRPEIAEASSKKVSKKALMSLGLGVLGLSGVLFAAAIIAIVLGNSAKEDIAVTGLRGRGLALTGVILGWIGVAVAVSLLALLLLTSSSSVVN